MATTTAIFDWRDLPFHEIWCIDTEFYPGAGLANAARHGDAMTPLAIVALEMRSGRLIRLWQDELGRFPPYRLDNDALVVGYMLAAEFGFHIAKGWGEPACALDAYIEFRHYVNDGSAKSGDRDKGFFGLSGALRYFCEDEIDVTRKTNMRDRILQGPPFSIQERRDIWRTAKTMCAHSHVSFRISVQLSGRCRMRCSAPSLSGRWRSRSDAAFRPTYLCLRVRADIGKVCGSIWSPS